LLSSTFVSFAVAAAPPKEFEGAFIDISVSVWSLSAVVFAIVLAPPRDIHFFSPPHSALLTAFGKLELALSCFNTDDVSNSIDAIHFLVTSASDP
jgi:hypothetical protein